MAKSIRNANVDFDDLFDPDIVGDGPAAANIRSGGVAMKYAALAYGTKRADVGWRAAGVDVSNLWAAKGTASYSLSIDGGNFVCNDQAMTQESSISATLIFSMGTSGTYTVQRAPGNEMAQTIATGTWNNSGEAAANFEVRFTVTNTGGSETGDVSNGAVTFAAMTTGRGFNVMIGPYPGANASERDCLSLCRVEIRRIATGQVVSDSSFHFVLQTIGYA